MRKTAIVGMVVWVAVILALLVHGCNFLKKNRKSSSSVVHRKILVNAHFSSQEAIGRVRIKKRSMSRTSTASARARARGDTFDDPIGSEIDPRYGVEKRLVPAGPNPLHH